MADFTVGKRVSSPFLPLEVMFNILLLIPAEILHSVMRCVCKDWYNIIKDPSFVSSHLLQASSAMAVEGYYHSNFVHYIDTSGCEIKLKKEEFPWKTKIITSCNGLWLLEATINNELFYYVANPVTKKLIGLPAPQKYHYFRVVGLVYAASIGAYKVVCVWKDMIRVERSLQSFCCCKKFVGVLTLGVDKSWRCIATDQTSFDHHWQTPLPIKGFIYWITTASNTVRSLDVDTESFHLFNCPKGLRTCHCFPVAMGDYLALLDSIRGLKFAVWVARELKRTGVEWTRLPDIDLGSPYLHENFSIYDDLSLEGWLKESELVLWQTRKDQWKEDCIVSNIKTGGISILRLVIVFGGYTPTFPAWFLYNLFLLASSSPCFREMEIAFGVMLIIKSDSK